MAPLPGAEFSVSQVPSTPGHPDGRGADTADHHQPEADQVAPGDGERRGGWVEDAGQDLDQELGHAPAGQGSDNQAEDGDQEGFAGFEGGKLSPFPAQEGYQGGAT